MYIFTYTLESRAFSTYTNITEKLRFYSISILTAYDFFVINVCKAIVNYLFSYCLSVLGAGHLVLDPVHLVRLDRVPGPI